LTRPIGAIFDDDLLKNMAAAERRAHLLDRQKVMRSYVASRGYLDQDEKAGDSYYIKGSLLYPSPANDEETTSDSIGRLCFDQSYNLGKDVFGSESGNVPFTLRSDGTAKNAAGEIIPVGEIIVSRPYDEGGHRDHADRHC
jgi:hypothetical protein